MTTPRARRNMIWAIIGASILVIALVAIIVSSVARAPQTEPTSTPTAAGTPSASSAPPQTEPPSDTVTPRGWIPEPVTRDHDSYIRAALAAASTFDPAKASRDDFLAYLATWFTPDTRWNTDADRERAMKGYLQELSQSVVLPEETWSDMRSEQAKVAAQVTGPITYVDVPNNPGGMYIGTADVTLTYSPATDASSIGTSTDKVRVSVQVLCGEGSIPAPNSAQKAGDCKVIRYFDTAVEG